MQLARCSFLMSGAVAMALPARAAEAGAVGMCEAVLASTRGMALTDGTKSGAAGDMAAILVAEIA